MNQHRYRLVFDSQRGMMVAVPEHVRGRGKSAGTTRAVVEPMPGPMPGTTVGEAMASAVRVLYRIVMTAVLGGTGLYATQAWAAPPIPRAASFNPASLLPLRSTQASQLAGDSGSFTISQPNGQTLQIDQATHQAIVNWASFNVGKGHTVKFVQPDATGSTLNKIWDADPSIIQGRISANGEVILQNGNGLIFGPTARVETGRFVATALAISEDAYKKGFRSAGAEFPVFSGSEAGRNAYVSLERGAEIHTAAGGDVLIFAPRVVNEGRIETPGGQTMLGAGQDVYLAASIDPAMRGMFVAIKPFANPAGDADINTVTQSEAGTYQTLNGETVADSTPDTTAGLVQRINAVVAERGTINLVAETIRQSGVLDATTAVRGENGVILLQAQAAVDPNVVNTLTNNRGASALGTVVLGADSITRVTPDTSTYLDTADNQVKQRTQVDSETFNASKIRIEGETIVARSGATVYAPSGAIELAATRTPGNSAVIAGSTDITHTDDTSRIVIESGATLNVAGLRDVALDGSRNQLSGRLFAIELADAPVQKGGTLYREEIFFDARKAPTIANVSGFYSGIARTASEKMTRGGTLSIQGDGAIAIDGGARLDVSGGSVNYSAADIKTSLVRKGQVWVPVDKAQADQAYDELGNARSRTDAGQALFKVEHVDGYVEGKDAGTLSVAARRIHLDGAIDGSTVSGRYQQGRNATGTAAAAQLIIGREENTSIASWPLRAVQLRQQAAATRPDAVFNDPSAADVDAAIDPTLTLSTAALKAAGIGRLTVRASDTVHQGADGTLELGTGGRLNIASNQVVLDGQSRAPGGSIVVTTTGTTTGNGGDITLGAGAALDVAGEWIDDNLRTRQGATQPATAQVNGGSVTLQALSDLRAADGAVVDVSGGAWRGASTTRGTAGNVTLAVNHEAPASAGYAGLFDWQGALRGYDFANGGGLTIAGLSSLTLDGTDATNPFDNDFFNHQGFGKFTLKTFGDAHITGGYALDLQLRNWLMNAGTTTDAAGRFASVGINPNAVQRAAVSLQIAADRVTSTVSPAYRGSDFTMDAGTRIGTEAGASLRFSAGRHLTVGGELSAPGGTLDLSIAGTRGGVLENGRPTETIGFDPAQALWLSETARLSVAGTDEQTVDAAGRHTGKVHGGGTITLKAQRGYVVTEAGALLDLDGHAATLSIGGASTPQVVSRSAGTLNVSSPEGVVLDATIEARAPNAQADGGTLNLAVTTAGLDTYTTGRAYGSQARSIVLGNTSTDATPAVAPGDDLNAALGNGEARVAVDRLHGAGFDAVTLKADDKIVLQEGLALDLDRRLVLDTRVLAAEGSGTRRLSAGYVALGDQRGTEVLPRETAPAATAGTAALDVQAGLIELHGKSALQGFDQVALSATRDAQGGATRSDGEVRLVGTTRNVSRGTTGEAAGQLAFAGDLTLTAGQLYSTTMSHFALRGLDGDTTLTTAAPAGGSTSAPPLSALGTLAIEAGTVTLGGVLRQPFGQINVTADSLTLQPGAVLSVSGDGQTVPVGTTINGRQWLYQAGGAKVPSVVSADTGLLDGLPLDKAITLQAATLDADATAQLSAAGGGELQAWEFVAGVGGNADALAKSGLYAVLPGYHHDYAPYDAEVVKSAATAVQAGQQITITMPGSGLAPGTYTLLPARYALLPGAFVVSLAPSQGSAPLANPIANADGSVVVTGSFGAVGSSAGSDAGTRILVTPQATLQKQSQFDLTGLNAFLAGNASRLDEPVPALPGDGGHVGVSATLPFNWQAQIDLQARNGGRAGTLDLAAVGGKLAVVDDVQAAATRHGSDWSLVSAAALTQAHADSVLLGGTRTVDGSTTTLDARSREVMLDTAAQVLQAGEVLFTAIDAVTLADAVQVKASGSGAETSRTLALQGDSAFAMVSNQLGTEVRRSGADGLTGRLDVGDDVLLQGPAVRLAGTADLALSRTARLQTQDLGVNARQLAIGAPSGAPEAGNTVLDGALLASVQQVQRLELGALSSIDFHGSQSFDVQRLTLDAPNLRGQGNAGDTVTLAAEQVVLRNTSGHAADPTLAGQTTLRVQASPALQEGRTGGLTVGSDGGNGTQHLGFAVSTLASSGDIVFQGQGRLSSQGDTTLQAMRVTAATAADHGVSASGRTLRIETPATGHTMDEITGVGARLAFDAQRIEQAGRVEALGGVLDFHASGVAGQDSLVFTAGSSTSAAGFSVASGQGHSAHGSAGEVHAGADQGHVVMAGTFDVSAPGDATAGLVNVSAVQGRVDLHDGAALRGSAADAAAAPGRFALDAAALAHNGTETASLDALATTLNDGGFHDEIALRLRNAGAATLGAGAVLKAQRVTVALDQGSLTIDGTVDARSAAGGVVQLFTGGDLTLNGRIDAASTRAGANGGDVLLSSADGQVSLGATARIDASGDDAQDGRVVLRARRAAGGGAQVDFAPGLASATQLQSAQIAVEAVKTYTGFDTLVQGSGGGTQLGQQTIADDNQAFADASTSWLTDRGLAGDARVRLDSGVEIVGSGDFTVRDDWDLYQDSRPGNAPSTVTIRASGKLAVNGAVSDGFKTVQKRLLYTDNPAEQAIVDESYATLVVVDEVQAGGAASLRFVAGADTGAANLLQTRSDAAADLSVAAGKHLRTTAGSIELAAARDVVLQGSADGNNGVVYVAGAKSQQVDAQRELTFNGDRAIVIDGSLWSTESGFVSSSPSLVYNDDGSVSGLYAQFTAHGGRLDVTAGRDVKGAPASQLTSAWFNHTGQGTQKLAWWSSVDTFRSGVASFGGGNLRVAAGRDVADLSAAAPTSALSQATASAVLDGAAGSSGLTIENGGDLTVRAGRDLLGGVYVLGRGNGELQAGRNMAAGSSAVRGLAGAAPLLGLMQGGWDVQARGALTLNTVYNPTLLPNATRVSEGYAASYATYSADSHLSARSTAGDLAWHTQPPSIGTQRYWSLLADSGPEAGRSNPGADFENAVTLAPAQVSLASLGGNLDIALLYAQQALYPSQAGGLALHAAGDLTLDSGTVTSSDLVLGRQLTTPVSALAAEPAPPANAVPVHWHADGSIRFEGGGARGKIAGLVTDRPARLDAGQDIVNLHFQGQNLLDTDLTSFTAGGSILQSLDSDQYRVSVGGPGEVLLSAGRQIDLGVSQGVETVGDARNAALPAQGANLTIQAGAKGTLDVDAFVQTYLSTAAPAASLQAQAEALADEFVKRVGEANVRANLGIEAATLRTQLVGRYTTYLALSTGQDGTAVAQRRNDLVRTVREALHLPALPETELAGAYDTALAQFRQLGTATQARFAQQQLAKAFAQSYLAEGKAYAGLWQQTATALGADPAVYDGVAFQRVQRKVLFEELKTVGGWASLVSANAGALRRELYAMGFSALDQAGLGESFGFAGDLDAVSSGVQTRQGGDLTMLAPGGQINVGLPGTATSSDKDHLSGVVAYGQADLSALARNDFQVNSQKVFIVGQGDLTVWSSQGNIDAGRGANTAVSVPPLVARATEYGTRFELPDTTVGAGIGILKPASGDAAGDIGLYAPNGEVRALDAMIRAPGRITLAAEVVRGADNIVGGTVSGAPVAAPTVSIAVAPTSSTAAEAQAAGAAGATGGNKAAARDRNSLLTVELLGLGLEPPGAGPADDCAGEEDEEGCRKKKTKP